MQVNSLEYLIFVLIVLAMYYSLGQLFKIQKYVLVVANIIFFLNVSGLKNFIISLILIGVVFEAAIIVEKYNCEDKKNLAKVFFYGATAIDIIVLCFFKFYKPALELIDKMFFRTELTIESIIKPVGIAFFSLTILGYLIDVYHKKGVAEKNFIQFIQFAFYFPAIVQGPFCNYNEISTQANKQRKLDLRCFEKGLLRFLWGATKKIVIADRIAIIVSGILGQDDNYGIIIFYAFFLYSFQIYADFSGGIDMIMGVSQWFGIELPENFKAPLLSQNVTEYWKRWHMTLGRWMERYVYYPIVFDKKIYNFSKKIKNKYYRNAFSAVLASIIVFILVGIWHGTGWNYVVYGAYQAFFVSFAIIAEPFYKTIRKRINLNNESISWTMFKVMRTMIILIFGRYLIKSSDLAQAWELLERTFASVDGFRLLDGTLLQYGLDYKNFIVMNMGMCVLFISDLFKYKNIFIFDWIQKQDWIFRSFICIILLFSIIVLGIYGPEYNESMFVYGGF